MRPLLIAPVLSLTLLAAPAPASGSSYVGGCGFEMPTALLPVRNPGARSTRTIAMYFAVAVTSDAGPGVADVTCELLVDGVPQAVLGPVTVVGAGVAAAAPATITSTAWGWEQCLRVDYADGTPDSYECSVPTLSQIPPHTLWEFLSPAFEAVEPYCDDVYVAYEWVYDCDGPQG